MPLNVDFRLPPAEAVRFFQGKGLQPSFAWQDMLHEEHDRAFTVAKMTDLDLLTDVKGYVDRAIKEGWTRQQFIDELKPELVRRGWWGRAMMTDPASGETKEVQLGSVRRLKTIHDVNMRTAHAAGREERFRRNAERKPYAMYVAVLDGRVRPQHRAWHGKILRLDDPWWRTHTPPNGWNCRCDKIQLGDRDLERMGKSGPDQAPPTETREWVNPRTGEIVNVPVGVDPGFGYLPGESGIGNRESGTGRVAEADHLARQKAAAAPPELRQAFLDWLDQTIERRRAAERR